MDDDIENLENSASTSELINSMIDNILNGEATAAKVNFDDIINSKVSDFLSIKKQEIAQSLYSNDEGDVEEDQEITPEDTAEDDSEQA